MESKNRIILASNSPRRKEILNSLGISFKVIVPSIKEECRFKLPAKIVTTLAAQKALSVSKKVQKPNAIIIGADTIVVHKKEIIGKPCSTRDAIKILKKLSGTRHKVYTGVALYDCCSKKLTSDYDISVVKMRELSLQEIRAASKKHLDKAGAYAVQEKSDAFVEKIEGDYFNVVGLPVKLLAGMLKKFGFVIKVRSLHGKP